MKLNLQQAVAALNGKTAQEVYDAMDFNALPYDEENNRYPTLDDVIAAIRSSENKTK